MNMFDNASRYGVETENASGQRQSKVSTSAGVEFKNRGASYRTQMTDEERAEECSKSDKVKFVSCLANPAKKQSRQDSHMHIDIPCFEVVGYEFELLEDARVPRADFKPGAKTFLDVEPIVWEDRKKGEIIALNIYETGAFVSQRCYGGQISGGGEVVNLIVKTSRKRPEPRPALRREGGRGSIKTVMKFVAEMVTPTDGRKPYPKVKPEYEEKFGNLFIRSSVTRANGSKNVEKHAHKEVAAALRELYAAEETN